jgi:shikimate kinase
MKFPELVYNAPVVFLLGMPMSGKSKLGKVLAKEKRCEFIDTDLEIEKLSKQSIPDLFQQYGENYFRKIEHEWLQNFETSNPTVIATGGGMPCYFDNMKILKSKGLTVYINLPPGIIANRASLSVNRPLFMDKSPEELKQFIHQLFDERNPFYLQSHVIWKPDSDSEAFVQI